MMADLVKVLVRTSSLFDGWYTTPMTRVLRVHPSDAQAKLPESRRRARYLWFPPRVRTTWIRLAPIRVLSGCRPDSNARFFPVDEGQNVCSRGGRGPPRTIQTNKKNKNKNMTHG